VSWGMSPIEGRSNAPSLATAGCPGPSDIASRWPSLSCVSMARVSGSATVRGIVYQHAHAVLAALDLLDDLDLGALRVEGVEDVVDIELFTTAGTVNHAKQVKTRSEGYTWGEAELVTVLKRWAGLPDAAHASFEFLTDGRLGPSGQKVQTALDEAANGRRQALAEILGEDADSAACTALAHARIRVDPLGTGALVLRAERQVAAMLPAARTAADAREQARSAVDALSRLLLERAGDPDPKVRVVTREQVAATVGIPANQSASHRWPGGVRDRYLRAARALALDTFVPPVIEPQGQVRPAVRRLDAGEAGRPLDCSALLTGGGPVILAGRTGTGKSTAGLILCRDAAETDRVVLLAHAETYLPGRLEALIADALADLLAEDLPYATGRQALGDHDLTLVIDGVSEVPASLRDALHDDLVASVAAGRGARIILLGRDVAALREVLPSSVTPASYQMVELDAGQRFDLACRRLHGVPAVDAGQHHRAVRTIVAQVEDALGDAAGNPLLFTMALTLVDEGIPFTSRATLYDSFVERLAQRSGATGIVLASAVLGNVYARLLDQGRRYADPYEWGGLVRDAASELATRGAAADPLAVDAAARRCGLITPVGYTQTLAPIHDSFADYLAGTGHARGLTAFPAHLMPGDDQRVLFAAEIGGVGAALAMLVARDLPFVTVRLAEFDHRELTEGAPAEVQALLERLLPGPGALPVALWHTADDRVVAMRHDQDCSAWVDQLTAQRLLEATSAVVTEDCGPLAIAVRLWRQDLIRQLRTPQAMGPRQPTSQQEAETALTAHSQLTATATARLIDAVAPPGQASVLAARVGPAGLTAIVYPGVEEAGSVRWSVSYSRTRDVSVAAVAAGTEAKAATDSPAAPGWGYSSADVLLARAPEAAAAKRVRDAITALTKWEWL
jgi:hypothetical protein